MDDVEERADLCGQTLDERYRVLSRIGLGGTGVVFDALHLRDHSHVAIKTLRPCFLKHPDLPNRLRREREVSRRVLHPGVVRFFDEGTLGDGSPYLVMPLLIGESLAALLNRTGQLSSAEVVALAARVASILHSSHIAGYVHRDVKPEHIYLGCTPRGELRLHLLDFGVCSSRQALADERKREAGRVFGTPSYVSPEQAAGEVDVDGRADLFGLGIVMFEALSGRLPFSASHVSKLLLRIIRDDAPPLKAAAPGIDPGLDHLVSKLLARDPRQRVPTARALSRALLPLSRDRLAAERRLAARLVPRALPEAGAITLHDSAHQTARVA